MFKPVTGEALREFDAETRALYQKRVSDPRLTDMLLKMPRPARNHLPVIASDDNPTIVQQRAYRAKFPYMMVAFASFFCFAGNQFSKIYFPYGIILRRSIPQTWQQYVSYRAPIGLFFLTLWYMQREHPRTQRMDLSCESEN